MPKKSASSTSNYLSELQDKLRGNTVNLILGIAIILVVIFGVVIAASKSENGLSPKSIAKFLQMKDKEVAPAPQEEKNEYVVREGDSLWSIAEAKYGSGFNYADIVSANKIENPDIIEKGQKLILPRVTPKNATVGESMTTGSAQTTIQSTEYTVKDGDSLWSISLAAYGDGYVWSRIASENNIVNPDYIEPGQKLKLWKK